MYFTPSGFPILRNKKLVYLDSAATSLKPQSVIDAINDYYSHYSANVFRGLYDISEKATLKYEETREKVAQFINAKSSSEIVFTSGTTESINLVAYAWGRLTVGEGDEIVTTVMEHHSNFVVWQALARENGGVLKVLDVDEQGKLKIKNEKGKTTYKNSKLLLQNVITKKTKLLAITHVSNVLGTINPIKEIVVEVKRLNPKCLVLVDGAQAVPHMKVDMQDLGCDYYAFSGHKMLGPTGIGVLWGRKELLNSMVPFQFGGSMIAKVSLTETTFKETPMKFEAGTPHVAGVIGLGAAVDYLQNIGMEVIRQHEIELTTYVLEKLSGLNHLTIYGSKDISIRGGVLSFNVFDKSGNLVHPHDVAEILRRENICVRVGHHCAMPLHERLGIPGSVRASLYLYNTNEDINRLVKSVQNVQKIFS
ncbi:cysteine desulfurase [Candidatus Roizmanbacteria bacterium]|nr:cysteine desulfurase [Candidatus Roizmanbacteria bacterium]